jgi:hypothetical protein
MRDGGTALRIGPVDGFPARLGPAHRCVLFHDVFTDVSHQVRAAARNVSLDVYGSER